MTITTTAIARSRDDADWCPSCNEGAPRPGFYTMRLFRDMRWHCHGTTHGILWHPHGISWRGIGYHGTAWHATGGTMATPTVTATTSPTALHGNPTACHGNPRGTTVSTAPRVGVRVRVRVGVRARVPWYAGEVRGSFRCMPWKVLPQVVPRQCNGMSRKITIMCIAHGAGRNRTLLVSLVHG